MMVDSASARRPLDAYRCNVVQKLYLRMQSGIPIAVALLGSADVINGHWSWPTLVQRIDATSLCGDGHVSAGAIQLVAEHIWEDAKEHDWDLRGKSVDPSGGLPERHNQVNYMLSMVEHLLSFVLPVLGLQDLRLRGIRQEAHLRRCGFGVEGQKSTRELGWLGCFGVHETSWAPEPSAITLSDRIEHREDREDSDVERIVAAVDNLYRGHNLVVYYPDPLVPTMRMLAGNFENGCTKTGAQGQVYKFGAGLANADIELFSTLSKLPNWQVWNIFEIGNAFGYSTLVLALAFPRARIDVIDAELDGVCAAEGTMVTRELVKFIGADVQIHVGLSPQDVPAAMRRPRKYELAFIDGQHTLDQLVLDFEAIQPRLANRSVVVLHDVESFNLLAAVKLLLVSHVGQGFAFYRARSLSYHNLLGTGLLVRGFSPAEVASVGEVAAWAGVA